MSAAAVVGIRIRRVFAFLRDRQAMSPETAVPESEVLYSDRWYYIVMGVLASLYCILRILS